MHFNPAILPCDLRFWIAILPCVFELFWLTLASVHACERKIGVGAFKGVKAKAKF
jgi:hypothetical protein